MKKTTLIKSCLLVIAFASSAEAADLTWNNGASTGNWNTADANWTGSTWTAGDNAIFNTTTGAINLTQAISAGSVTFGLPNANHTGSFSGAALSISGDLLAQADGNNGPGGPNVAFSNDVTIAGDLKIARRVVQITGGNFTANRVLSAGSWGRLLVSGGAVSFPSGIDDSINGGNTMSVVLFGGSLSVPYIKTTAAGFTGLPSDGVVLSGGTLIATSASTDFIQTYQAPYNWGNRNTIGVGIGGANINTNGYDITITKSMINYDGAGALTKSGAGKLTLAAFNHNTGGTTVNQGTLEVAGATGGWGLLRGSITVNAGASLQLTGGDGTGFGWNAPITSLNINGGTVNSPGTMHVWNISGGINMTGGTLQNNNGVSAASGPQMEWNAANVTTNASADTATIGGRIRMRADGGYPGITFNVADGAAATDLLVSAAVTQASAGLGVIKSGAGTMELSGANSYSGSTVVNGGTLVLSGSSSASTSFTVNDTASLALSAPILDDIANVVIASGGKMALNFSGTDTIGGLEIAGSGVLPAGVYDATHPIYGSFFTGTGSLLIPGSNGTWTSLANGNWSDAANWSDSNVAVGYDASATFNAATGATVTLDSNRKIGSLAFDVSNYTLAGSGILTLDAAGTPSVSVTADRTATISANLAGTDGLEKTGLGKLVLSGVKSYSGVTTVSAGTLELAGATSGNSIIGGTLNISPAATVSITGGDGTGFGWNNPVTALNINNGTINANSAHIGFGAAVTVSITNGSSIQGVWQWNDDNQLGFSSHGDATNTISGQLILRSDAGANHTFTVNDGLAATDLQVDAILSDQWPEINWVSPSALVKAGSGTMVLNGANSYDGNTVISAGTLKVSSTGRLHFRPTTNGATNSVSNNGDGLLIFLGTVDLDLGAANATIGNSWTLFNLSSFGTAPDLSSTAAVTSTLGAFTEVSAGVWELAVTGAKWVFTESDGKLAYASAATDLDTWKTANGVTGANGDDDDADGLSNFEEYAFGLDPTGGSSINPIVVPLDKTTGNFSYTRRQQSLTGLTYTVWYSTDLATWTQDSGATQGTATLNGEVETVPVTLSNSLLTNPTLFFQVRAE